MVVWGYDARDLVRQHCTFTATWALWWKLHSVSCDLWYSMWDSYVQGARQWFRFERHAGLCDVSWVALKKTPKALRRRFHVSTNQSEGESQKPQNGLSTQICIPRTFTEHGEITKMPRKQARKTSKTWAWEGPLCKTRSFRKRCSTKPNSLGKSKPVSQPSQLHNEPMLAGMFWKSSKLGHLLTGMQDLSSTCLNLMIPPQGKWKAEQSVHIYKPTTSQSPPRSANRYACTTAHRVRCQIRTRFTHSMWWRATPLLIVISWASIDIPRVCSRMMKYLQCLPGTPG